MTTRNGHRPRALLYGRVSNRAQDDRGLSIPAQFAELRVWCAANGYEAVGEVADRGGKGSKRDDLERAGLDELYDAAERLGLGEGDVVIAQAWDRIGENDVPGWVGRRLAAVSGARLRTPDDPNEEGDDGADLLRLVGRWNAGRERRLVARRTRSRKLELARTGHVVPSHTPSYGYDYAGTHKARLYEVHEERAAVVRRIFREVADGTGIRTLVRALDAEGIPLPPGKGRPRTHRGWNRQFVRDLILNDAYKPHAPGDLDALVASGHLRPEVRDRAGDGSGVWWYAGRDYEGETHRVAVPVPGVGVPPETVREARRRLANNRPASDASGRFWSLSRGVMVCGSCGRNMVTHTVRKPGGKIYSYYRCLSVGATVRGTCPAPFYVPAGAAEAAVWAFVAGLRASPGAMLDALEDAIDGERARLRTDPADELRGIARLTEGLAARRGNYQDQQAAGLMTIAELRTRLEGIEEERAGLERRAASARDGGERLGRLEEARDLYARSDAGAEVRAAMDGLFDAVLAEELEKATPERQRGDFESLDLRAVAVSRDELELSGRFGEHRVGISETSLSRRCTPTTPRRP